MKGEKEGWVSEWTDVLAGASEALLKRPIATDFYIQSERMRVTVEEEGREEGDEFA